MCHSNPLTMLSSKRNTWLSIWLFLLWTAIHLDLGNSNLKNVGFWTPAWNINLITCKSCQSTNIYLASSFSKALKPTSWSKMLVDGMPMPWDIERMGPTLYIAYLPHIWRKKTTTCGQRFWQPGGENRSRAIFWWFLTCGNARWCQEDMCLWVKINLCAREKRHLNFHHCFFYFNFPSHYSTAWIEYIFCVFTDTCGQLDIKLAQHVFCKWLHPLKIFSVMILFSNGQKY